MIRLYESIETDFTHNGIQVLNDIVYGDTCILTNEINGTYSLEMEFSIVDNEKWKDIDNEMFLRVPTSKGEQIFRIKELVKGINSIKVYGKHVFYDLENNFILDTNIVQKDGRVAINQILGAMSNNMVNTYYGTSDISVINNARLVRKNVVSALIGSDDNSFINRWGGELEVDNFNFSMKERIGEDRDFQIRYRKNLTGFEGNTNTYNLCTRIVPVGYDGIMLEGTKWVDSQYINNYPQIYTYEIKFDNIKVKQNEDDEEGYNTLEEAQVALRQATEEYFITSKCDIPSFSANINFETLKYTEEYKDLNILERVELGDDVNIYIDKIDINITARVVKTTYNFFTKKYIEIEIGDVKPNLFKQIADIKNTIDLVTEQLGGNSWQDILDKALNEATKLMQEGLKDSYVITMKNQIVIGDDPDINNMVNCIVMNKNGIGFSNNGYLPEQLVSAMTIDGKINASCINVGELNAALIKVGVITGKGGTLAISVEDDYIHMTHTDSNTSTKIDAEGFYIVDSNGETIASLASKDSWTELKADNVFADNVENVYLGDSNLYVDHAYTGESDGTVDKPFKSFSELTEHLGTGKIINKTVNINIVSTGDIYDCFQMFGFSGRGNFNITFNKTSILRWAGNHTIDFRDIDITCRLYFGNTGNTTNDGAIIDNRTTPQGTYTHCMYFNNCKKIIIADGVRVRSAQWASDNNSGICSDNSYIQVQYIDTCDSGCGFYVANGGKIVVIDSRGNCTIKLAYILNGGALYQGMPGQNCLVQMGNSVVQNGHNYTFGTLTGSNSLLTSPPSPPTQDTRYLEFNMTDYGYWNELYNSWNSNGKTIYQGSWSGYGNCRGVFTFNNTSINSYLSSATVLDGSTITLQRENAGGYSSAQTIYLCGTTHTSTSGSAPPITKSYGAVGSLAWGEKKTFTLPKTFVNDLKSGLIKSVMLYTSDGSNYIKFSAVCTLKLKVNK